jgi:hypothetical protein
MNCKRSGFGRLRTLGGVVQTLSSQGTTSKRSPNKIGSLRNKHRELFAHEFNMGLGLLPKEAYAGGVGYPPCLAGEESWNWSGKKLAVCRFCDTEFQKASRQLNIGRVAPEASASEGSNPTHYKIVHSEAEDANISFR